MKPHGASTVYLHAAGVPLIDALHARFPQIDRATWRQRFQRQRVLDEQGRALEADALSHAGQCVHYFREVADEPRIDAAEHVVHADADLVVADKPPLLPVMPAGRFVSETLLARLRSCLGNPDLVPLHRIDRDTSGLVLFSARKASRAAYVQLFTSRRIEKIYQAQVHLAKAAELPTERASRIVRGEPFFRMCEVEGRANAHTRIEVIARHGDLATVRLQPVTGRKHQLRVHMAALEAPILNDRLYPQLGEVDSDDADRPLALLAHSLAFIDPLTGKRRVFHSQRMLAPLASAPDGPDMHGQ
ncbi:pseudouridine synthase [Oleiagrimonas sp. C23AA]|uniref:pseudouridine synthase n=1 Tax=Oleiagrimonas sp. C23AA TaxID=2719047 RepID=UPI00141FCE29|nr:pseudouridine synthase [Oleiagrimonas sp. C23AA]NII09613.1 pseudouridine synthase [Oleiagrimonas sp. C23AA]